MNEMKRNKGQLKEEENEEDDFLYVIKQVTVELTKVNWINLIPINICQPLHS